MPKNPNLLKGGQKSMAAEYARERKNHKHLFKRVSGTEVSCECGLGYFLSGKAHLKEGHLYIGKKLVI